MGSSTLPTPLLLAITTVLLLTYISPVHAFGAGNIASISSVEGTNFRHGDIEDTLLTLITSYAYGKGAKFSKLDVQRVYFGNWLRDYSQAVDVGTVKHVSADAIRILLWVLGFLTFGYGTGEFEVTKERLGCYRPEEHIDNPKDYADNEDATQYDPRLRGPVNEEIELAIDQETGLKNYIANERAHITTSAGLVRNLFGRAIQLGRQYNRDGNKATFYEALRLLGTGCHCLEDYSAHSNYTELALIELGEHNVFPHVGRRTQVHLPSARHPVYPIITGTFGGVDFLHSVMGELDDKTTQSEISELQGVMQQAQNQDTSLLRNLLDSLPSSLFGGKNQAGRVDELQQNAAQAHMQNMNISPREPEAWTQQLDDISHQIYPILEFHDDIMKSVAETIDKIPILPDLIEQVQEQVSKFVFTLIAPFVLPIIRQVQTELATGSSEVIQSSKDKQLIVFHDDHSTDPTHSMLSKDHFSNILNEPAGKIGCAVLRWVVPQIVSCWDDEHVDVHRTLNRIIHGVFHHPALVNLGDDGARDGRMVMFGAVQEWWGSKSEHEKADLRHRLSRQGVETGKNHKEGVTDSGHGCCKPIGLAKPTPHNTPGSAVMQGLSQVLAGGQSQSNHGNSTHGGSGLSQQASNAFGGGILGSVVGDLVGGAGASLLGSAFGSSHNGSQTHAFQSSNYNDDGSYTSSTMQTGHRPSGHGQQFEEAEYKTTQYPDGGYRQEYDRYDQSGSKGYGYEQSNELRPTPAGGYEQRTEERWEHADGRWNNDIRRQSMDARGHYNQSEERHHGYRRDGIDVEDNSSDEEKRRKRLEKERRKREKEERRRHGGGGGGGGGSSDSSDDDSESSRRGHNKQHHRDENHGGGSSHRQQYLQAGYTGATHGGETYQGYGQNYQQGSSYERQEARFEPGHGQERPAYGGHEERPPNRSQEFIGNEFGGPPGSFDGGAGAYEQPHRTHEFGGGHEEPRHHGHQGRHHGHH